MIYLKSINTATRQHWLEPKNWRNVWRAMALFIAVVCASNASFAAKILVLNTGSAFSSPPSDIAAQMTTLGHNVTQPAVGTIPAAFSTLAADPVNGYDQVWVFGATPSANQAALTSALAAYINQGGAVYAQSEVDCCNAEAAAAMALMQSVGNTAALLPGFSHSEIEAVQVPIVVNSALSSAEMACVPAAGLGDFRAFRRTDNIAENNQLFVGELAGVSHGPGVVFLRASDMTSGNGSLLVNGDRNLLSYGGGFATALDARGLVFLEFFINALGNMSSPTGTGTLCSPGRVAEPSVPVPVPLVSAWGLALLSLFLASMGLLVKRRNG